MSLGEDTNSVPTAISSEISSSGQQVAAPQAPDYARELEYAERVLDEDFTHLNALFRYYMHNFLKYTSRTSVTAFRACHILEGAGLVQYEDDYKGDKFPVQNKKEKSKQAYEMADIKKGKVSEADWRLLKEYFAKDSKPVSMSDSDTTYKNILRLSNILGLQEAEKKTLEFLYLVTRNSDIKHFLEMVFVEDLAKTGVGMARMLDRPTDGRAFFTALNSTSRLQRFGLVYHETSSRSGERTSIPEIDDFIMEKLSQSDMTDDEIVSVLLGTPAKPVLNTSDFAYIGEPLDFAIKLIDGAVKNNTKGVNILIHGPAGSGKTNLAETIADHLGFQLFSAGESQDADNNESMNLHVDNNGADRSTDRVRIAQLRRIQALLEKSQNSIVKCDEIEDFLVKGTDSSKSADTQNKLQVNRMLEENPVPTIYTGNNPEKFHESFMQRFSYTIFMDYPPTLVREKIWKRRLEMSNVTLPDADIRALAREYAAPPRMITHAVEALKIIGGGVETIRQSLAGQSTNILIDEKIPKGFDLDDVRADCDLPELFNRLVKRGLEKKPYSLLVETGSDMGAENMLHLMAEQMVMNPMEMNVGALATPQPMQPPPADKIAEAFEQAVSSRKFLIFTDLQEIVADHKSEKLWQGDLVKFMTDQILKHKLPFAVTVKQGVEVPDFVRMAFSDSVKILPASNDNAAALYRKNFGHDLPEQYVQQLEDLAVSDFLKTRSFLERQNSDGSFAHDKVVDLLRRFKERRTADPEIKMGFN